MHALLALALAAQLSAPGWETVADPALGLEVLRPAGWSVELLANEAVAIKDAPDSPQALANEVMRRRAAWLLEQAPDLF